jgi:hypothetical protein
MIGGDVEVGALAQQRGDRFAACAVHAVPLVPHFPPGDADGDHEGVPAEQMETR